MSRSKRGAPPKFTREQLDALYIDYRDSGMSLADIADKYNISQEDQIAKYLRENGYPKVEVRKRTCLHCGLIYPMGTGDGVYCTKACRKEAARLEEMRQQLPSQTEAIRIAVEAEKHGMSYGQYVAWLWWQKMERGCGV